MEEAFTSRSRNLADLHGGEIEWEVSRRYGIPISSIASFANTVGPFIPPSIQILKSRFGQLYLYPPRDPEELIGLIAAHEGTKPQNVVVGSGSTELIYHFVKSLGTGEVALPIPTYSEYEIAARKFGLKPVFIRSGPKFDINIQAVKRAITKHTKSIMVCNPNNPTGRLFEKDSMIELATIAKRNEIILFVDQAYLCFAPATKRFSMVELIDEYPIFVLNSLSKLFGVPSLRLGWGVASPLITASVSTSRIPGTLSNLSIWAGEALLKDLTFQKSVERFVEEQRMTQHSGLSGIKGLKVYPSDTNYFLIELEGPRLSSTTIFEDLARMGIVVRDCSRIRGLGNRYLRVTIRSASDNRRLLEALARTIEAKAKKGLRTSPAQWHR